MTLEEFIEDNELKLSPEQFKYLISSSFNGMFPDQTTEYVLCRWRLTRDYCRHICKIVKVLSTPENEAFVIGQLINMRKRKQGNLNRKYPAKGQLDLNIN